MQTISFPFTIDTRGSVAMTTDPRKIWLDRVRAVVSTQIGDRVMRPEFGTDTLNAVLGMDGVERDPLERALRAAFSAYLPALALTDVSVSSDGDGLLTVNITYTLPNRQEVSTIVTFQDGSVIDEPDVTGV